MKIILKMFNRKNKDADFLKQLRKELVIEIIRKRASADSPDVRRSYKLTIEHEAELLALYVTGEIKIGARNLVDCYNEILKD